jgi:hydrogenase maturation factor
VVQVGDDDSQTALVRSRDDGPLHRVSLALLRLDGDDVRVGDWVAVHTGLVVRRIDSTAGRSVGP